MKQQHLTIGALDAMDRITNQQLHLAAAAARTVLDKPRPVSHLVRDSIEMSIWTGTALDYRRVY